MDWSSLIVDHLRCVQYVSVCDLSYVTGLWLVNIGQYFVNQTKEKGTKKVTATRSIFR